MGAHSIRRIRPKSPVRAAVVAAIGALVIFSGVQWADASQDGSDAAVAAADPTPGATDDPAAHADQAFEPDYNGVFHEESGARGAFAAQAGPTGPSGPGWKSWMAHSLLPTGYTFKFKDQRAADWLGPHIRPLAAHLSQFTGLRFSVDMTPVASGYRKADGDLLMHLYNRPCKAVGGTGISTNYVGVTDGSGAPFFSCGFTWVRDLTTTAGEAWINTQHFNATGGPAATFSAAGLSNLITHEVGHTLGLAHANDSEREGDCLKGTDAGQLPVMCRPSSAAYKDRAAGRYVQQFDLQGLRVMAADGGAQLPPQGPIVGVAGKCLDIRGGSSAQGTQIQLYKCNGTWAQKWIIHPDGSIGALGKCLDNHAAGTQNGNKIQLHTCNGTAAQKWQLNAKGQLVNPATGKVLDVKGGATADGTVVQLYTSNTGKGQLWKLPTTV